MNQTSTRRRRFPKKSLRKNHKLTSSPQLLQEIASSKTNIDLFFVALLLAFGIYHSVLYFGHQPVPHFDFNCFANLGHQLLSFQVPSSFKRVPLVGIMQVLLGHIVGGKSPDFTGGLLLNAILHPLIAVLLWLVGRRIIGKSALWFAIIAIINPWMLQLLTEAIAEVTLLFSVLTTFYFMFRRSNLCYVFASITTMVRYEGAALIAAAFVMDMIYCESKQQRIRAFAYSALASVPLMIWMTGTLLNWQSEGPTHYLKIFSNDYKKQFSGPIENRTGIIRNMKLLWQVGFRPLFMPPVGGG